MFFEGEKSRKVDSRFLHAVSLHRRSDGCGPSVVAPHDCIVRIKTINPLFFFLSLTLLIVYVYEQQFREA